MNTATTPLEVIWHDVECGAYAADLAAWTQLAGEAAGPVLDLGAGTGRVSLALAAAGSEVTAFDRSPVLIDELRRRAQSRALAIETAVGDARELALDRRFAAILAPMQFVHLLGGPGGREALLGAVAAHLRPGGTFAAALLAADGAGAGAAGDLGAPLPDVRELDGWVYSSLPLEVTADADAIEVRRLRQRVSPAGQLDEEVDSVRLDRLDADELEREAAAHGLRSRERLDVAPTSDHVGSLVCVFEAAP
jgi:SAM-dependent methyltransferase